MPSVWSDDAPSRESVLIPPGDLAKRKHYGFDGIKQIGIHAVERYMVSACKILIKLLQDVDDYDKGLASGDARELVYLIYCLHRDLVSAFKIEMDERPGKSSEYFNKVYKALGDAIKRKEKILDKWTGRPLAPTSRTLIELITRIIAQRCNTSLTLETYQERLSNLRVSKWLCDDRKQAHCGTYIGIPIVVFVCIHTTDSNGDGAGPQHVIGTSKEKWPGLSKLKYMDWELRNQRLADLDVLKERTIKVWDTVEKIHDHVYKPDGYEMVTNKRSKKEKATRTEESISKAREAAVAELQHAISDSEKLSHRDEDQAAAFFFPEWTLGGRCFKCQSLYPFTMHPEAKSNERTSSNLLLPLNKDPSQKTPFQFRFQFQGYAEGGCAEDLVFPWCQTVNILHSDRSTTTTSGVQGDSVPPTTTTTSGAQGDGQQQQQQQQQKEKKKRFLDIVRFQPHRNAQG